MSTLADLNKSMYDVLIIGMILSTLTYVVGLILFFVQHPQPLEATLVQYPSVGAWWQDLLSFQSAAVLTLATVILIATPITRVFVSIWVFAANRDGRFVMVTVVVALILLASMALGYVGHFQPQ